MKTSRNAGIFRTACVLVAAVGVWALAAYARKKPKNIAPPDLPTHVNNLVRQLSGVPLDESEPIAAQVQKLVFDDLDRWLNEHPPGNDQPVPASPGAVQIPYDVKVRREMEYAFSKLHYPFVGQPAAFTKTWKGATLVGAGYMLGWTDQDRTNVVALFESRDGKSRQVAVKPFVPGNDLHYSFFPDSAAGDFRFLVYGWRLGKSHPRLSAVLYSFDGQALKPVWKNVDAYDGKIDVNGDAIAIRYLKEQEFVQAVEQGRTPPRYEATYKVTPHGITLTSDQPIPY